MIRLGISVEGPTEYEFVKQVIGEHLLMKGVAPHPVLLGKEGGNVTVERLASDMARLYWSFDVVSSLVDFYGFRGKAGATVEMLEQTIAQAVEERVTRQWDASRVIPYVQMHEFEGLLFSHVDAFAGLIGTTARDLDVLQRIRSQFLTPEDIDDGVETAPSKRIVSVLPKYHKYVNGPQIAMDIGLAKMREECPRFNKWVMQLESLGTPI